MSWTLPLIVTVDHAGCVARYHLNLKSSGQKGPPVLSDPSGSVEIVIKRARFTEADAEAHVHGIAFKTGPPQRVGVELEWLVRNPRDPAQPVRAEQVAVALAPFEAGTPARKGGGTGRGVPDVAGNADPSSGYPLLLNGQSIGVWGGTSAVAPLYAGLCAVLHATLGAPLGFLNQNLYTNEGPYVFDDVTSGTNGSYNAGPGWDPVTGLGSINGTALNTALLGIGLPPALASYDNKLFMAWKGMEFDDRIFFTTSNGSTWAPQTLVPGVGTSAGVALAVFGNQLYMAWKGEGFDQGIYWSSFNGTSWAPQKQVAGVATSSGPRLAVDGNALYMAWKGMEDDQRLWWSSFNGSAWAAQQEIPGVASSVGPAIVTFNNQLFAAWKGEFGDPGLYYSTFNGSSWAPQKLIAGTGTSEGPSLTVFGNQLFAAWKGEFSDQTLWYASFNGTSWTPQKQIPGVFSSIGPGITTFGNLVFAAWKGMTGDERIWWSTYNGASWAAQQVVPGVGTSTDLLVEATA